MVLNQPYTIKNRCRNRPQFARYGRLVYTLALLQTLAAVPYLGRRESKRERDSLQKMVSIRLRRVGAKKQPSYRIVVADKKSPRDGRFIENIGHFNPRTEPETVVLDNERALYWLSMGAQPSDAVRRLLVNAGVMAEYEASKQTAA